MHVIPGFGTDMAMHMACYYNVLHNTNNATQRLIINTNKHYNCSSDLYSHVQFECTFLGLTIITTINCANRNHSLAGIMYNQHDGRCQWLKLISVLKWPSWIEASAQRQEPWNQQQVANSTMADSSEATCSWLKPNWIQQQVANGTVIALKLPAL